MAPKFGACVAVFSLALHSRKGGVDFKDMDRKPRSPSPFFFPLSKGLCALSIVLSLSACDDQDLPWSPEPSQEADSTQADLGPQTKAPLPAGHTPGAENEAPAGEAQGSTHDCDEASGGGASGKGAGPGKGSGGGASSDSGEASESGSEANADSPLNLELWEVLYNPSGSDGLAASPEVLELLVSGPANHEGKLLFELQGQGWSPLASSDFDSAELGKMRAGSILRIERYKNQNELDKANQQFPLLQIVDPKSGELAVQILRRTGAGLRNKGGWLKIRSGSSNIVQGVIYGEIPSTKIDEEVAALWQGPFANPAPSGQALCQIPDSTSIDKHSAAWWTACEASQWGRDKDPTAPKGQKGIP